MRGDSGSTPEPRRPGVAWPRLRGHEPQPPTDPIRSASWPRRRGHATRTSRAAGVEFTEKSRDYQPVPKRGPLSDELVPAVGLLSDTFAARSIRHVLIGRLATSMRSRPRLTQDVDVLLDVPQLALQRLGPMREAGSEASEELLSPPLDPAAAGRIREVARGVEE